MKKIVLILLVVCFGFSAAVVAQSARHSVKFSSHIEGTDDVNITSQEIPDQDYIFLGNKSKMSISASGMTQSIIVDGDKQTYTLVLETPMEGYYLEMPFSEIKEKSGNVDFKYEYTNETKTIAGVECKKVLIQQIDNETDEIINIVVYVTNLLPDVLNEATYIGLKGYPLRTEMPSAELGEGVVLVTEAVEFTPSKKIKEINFMLSDGLKNMREDPELMKQIMGEE